MIDDTQQAPTQVKSKSEAPLSRRPWETPRVIVSKAEQAGKVANTNEYTFGVIHRYGPS